MLWPGVRGAARRQLPSITSRTYAGSRSIDPSGARDEVIPGLIASGRRWNAKLPNEYKPLKQASGTGCYDQTHRECSNISVDLLLLARHSGSSSACHASIVSATGGCM